ncbi:MAG: zinc-binding alcohol dehydrogenase family protein [Myxococcota bacterium]
MKAAVITSFDQPPRYADFAEPVVKGPHEIRVEVLAAALHHLTMARAVGKHYSGSATLPLVPGVDGVGRDTDGKLRYFVLEDTPFGSLAERTIVDPQRSLVLPRDCDPVTIAAAMNPAMAAWLALRCRVPFKKKQQVLILGATGNAGTLAVQIARHLGASRIIACGRDEERLEALKAFGASDVVPLDDARMGDVARDVDVVLDFVWGEVSARSMDRVVRARADRSRTLTWIEIGSMAGSSSPVAAELLRAARVQLVGSGIGSVPGREIVKELPALVKEITRGTLRIDVTPVPLREVERAWREAERSTSRIVLTP